MNVFEVGITILLIISAPFLAILVLPLAVLYWLLLNFYLVRPFNFDGA